MALPMVLLVFVLSVLLVTAFLVAIVGSSQVTSITRATIQAQAAAEAGIEDALSLARDGDPCVVGPISGSNPSYHVDVACNPGKTHVTFTSTGSDTAGNEQTVQAVYLVNPSTPPITTGGPGLFYSSTISTRLNGYEFDAARSELGLSENAAAASIYASSGKIECGSGSVLPSNVYSGTGGAQIDGGCVIEGSAYVGGRVFLNGGEIKGDIVSPSTQNHTIAGKVGSNEAGGNIMLGGTLTLNGGTVTGSVVAAGSGSSTLGSGSIGGNFTYRGSYSTWGTPVSGIVSGSIARDTTLAVPALPEIPPWQDVTFNPINSTTPPQGWVDEGFTLVTVPGSECSRWAGNDGQNPIWPTLSAVTTPTVFDVRACPEVSTNSGLTEANKTINLQTDIGVIVRKATLTGLTFASASDQTMWFITPDPAPSSPGPQCTSSLGEFTIRGNTFGDQVAVYLYTPCIVNFNSAGEWRGQIYSGDLTFGGGVKIAFAPRSIPGYDFSDGSADGDGSGSLNPTATLGAIVSQRNID